MACAAPAPAPAPAEAEYHWRSANPLIEETTNDTLDMMAAVINSFSDGGIKVDFYSDGLLGSHSEIFHGVQEGNIKIGIFSPYLDIVPSGIGQGAPCQTLLTLSAQS